MNVLFLYISLPHLSENGVFIDLIKEFKCHGHNVKVVTPAKEKLPIGLNHEAGIEVVRFKTDQLINNTSNVQKGIAYMKLSIQFPFSVFKYFWNEKFDLIIAHSLPAEIGLITKILKKRYNAKFYLMLCEYVWQDSVSLGFFKENSIICKYYKFLEKLTIKTADYIGSPSEGNINFTLKYYPWAINKNIHVLHYNQAPINIKLSRDELKSKFKLDGKFIVIYGGNMSIAQKIENVIDLAEACALYPDILFIFLGRGQDVDRAKEDVNKRSLKNVVFLDFMPKEDYHELLYICDVGLVSLNEKLAVPNIPSKTLSYFNLSIPVIASIDFVTDYGYYIEKAGAGLWSYAGDLEKFKHNLMAVYNSQELKTQLGKSGYNFYLKNMLPVKGYNVIMNMIQKI